MDLRSVVDGVLKNHKKLSIILLFASLHCLLVVFPSLLLAAHGVSIDGNLKYPPAFSRFDYTSEKAAKGGTLLLYDIGSFDKMNPYTLRGVAPFGLTIFVFETLAVPSLDEPFSQYGLLAKDIDLAEDKMSVTFTLDEKAKFSDGSPVRPEDVVFSFKTFKSDKVHPGYPYYYQDLFDAEVLDGNRVKFTFAHKNRELHLISTQMPILSKAFYTKHPFDGDSDGLIGPVGSGPYIVSDIQQGKSITYTRNPNYWAKEHPTRKGMYNFDRIVVKYYKDQIVALEALKAGEFDFMAVSVAKQWARDMNGKKFTDGTLVKEKFPHQNNAGLQGFLMNSRRAIFKDTRVRKAMGLALDFEWTNKSLFYGQYIRNNSFFSNSYLAATGLPTGLELSYLEPFRDSLPAEVFTTPLKAPETSGKRGVRENLRKAKKMLAEAGWTIEQGVLQDAKGTPFSFEIILVSPFFERVMAPYVANLKKLGMQVSYRTIDPALYTDRVQKFDFDMIVHSYGQSQSPGNEQVNYWHSKSADRQGSMNLAGIKDKVVDNLVEKIVYAETQEQLTAACKALDRVLWYSYYMVPNWYADGHRIVFHKKFAKPDLLPFYYNHYQLLMTWWMR